MATTAATAATAATATTSTTITQEQTISSPHPTTNTTSNTSPLLTSLREDGYVIIPNLISFSQLTSLREASQHITDLARNNLWPYIRSVPKQYPPWPPNTPGTNIWGIQHLLHPSMPNRPTFATLYFSNAILNNVKALINPSTNSFSTTSSSSPSSSSGNEEEAEEEEEQDNNLVMELLNLLVSPTNQNFELAWHRDDVKPDLTPDQEIAELAQKSPQGKQLHAQYNLALTADCSLIVVPGSHRRARTREEREASAYQEVTGQKVVRLQAGDCVFYDSNILHRAKYDAIGDGEGSEEVGRLTVHGSVGLKGFGSERGRQVLQHGVGGWIGGEEAGFGSIGLDGNIARRAEGMRRNLIEMGSGDGLGYSLEG